MAYQIMSVDDSDIAQEYIRASLFEIGYENVVGYQSPLKALEDLTSGLVTPDLLLLDVMMPDIDGVELCARIRELERLVDTPIIMLTSRTDVETLNLAFLAGANDYVTKPFNRIELRSRMRNCLRLKAELDRRLPAMGRRRQAGAPIAEMSEVINNQAGFQAALQAIPTAEYERIGLIVFRVIGLDDAAGLSSDDAGRLYRIIGGLLGAVTLPAGHMFCHWNKDLFCLATVDLGEDEMRTLAEGFIAAIPEGAVVAREDWASRHLSIAATLTPPGPLSAAAALGQTIAAAEQPPQPAELPIRTINSNREQS